MERATRSLIEPPGLNCSHLQKTSAIPGPTRWRKRTSGVPPMSSSMLLEATAGIGCDCTPTTPTCSSEPLTDFDDGARLNQRKAEPLPFRQELVALGTRADEDLGDALAEQPRQKRNPDGR